MKILFLTIILSTLHYLGGFAQPTLIDKEGKATFFSEAPLENIKASNKSVVGALNPENGNVAVSMLMSKFEFKKSLMQEHFNENYVESEKFPKATFKGSIRDFSKDELLEIGKKSKTVTGEITIHGVTQPLETVLDIETTSEKIMINTVFMLKVESFDIEIPKVVFYNIAEEVEVTTTFNFSKPK